MIEIVKGAAVGGQSLQNTNTLSGISVATGQRDTRASLTAKEQSQIDRVLSKHSDTLDKVMTSVNEKRKSGTTYPKKTVQSFPSLMSPQDKINLLKSQNQKKNAYKDYSFSDMQQAISEAKKQRDSQPIVRTDTFELDMNIAALENIALTKDYNTVEDYDKVIRYVSERTPAIDKELETENYKRRTVVGGEEEREERIKQLASNRDRLMLAKANAQKKSTLLKRSNEIVNKYGKYEENADYSEPIVIEDDGRTGKAVTNPLHFFLAYKSEWEKDYDLGIQTYNAVMSKASRKGWGYLKDEEIHKYEYLLKKEGKEKAEEYLEDMEIILTKRATDAYQLDVAQRYEDASDLGKVAMNIESIPANIVGGLISGADDIISVASGKGLNPYSADKVLTTYADVVRGETAEDIQEKAGQIAAVTYQAVMSGADAIVGSWVLGPTGYSVSMGLGTASRKAKELYESGATNEQIYAGAIASGLIETVFEKVSIESFVKMKDVKSFKQLFINALKQGGIEASEEFNTEIANMIADSFIQGYNSNSSQTLAEYINSGMTMEQAKKQVAKDNAINAFWAAYSGFVSGGGMTTVGGSINLMSQKASDNSTKRALGRNAIENGSANYLVSTALNLNKESEAYSIAKNMSEKDTKSPLKVGGLVKAMLKQPVQEIRTAFVSNMEKQIIAAGESGQSAHTLAEMIFKKMQGKTLTAEETSLLESSNATQQVLKDNSIVLEPQGEASENQNHNLDNPENADAKTDQAVTLDKGVSNAIEDDYIDEVGPDFRKQLFTEAPDKEIARDLTAQQQLDALTGESQNAKQRQLEAVAEKLSVKLRWSNKVTRGTWNPVNKTVTLNPDMPLSKMYLEVFKHEFTHSLETRRGYKDFKRYLFEDSISFEDYCRKRLEAEGRDNTGTREEIVKAFVELQYENYRTSSEIPQAIRDRFTMEDAQMEAVADFVGDNLLAGDSEATIKALTEMAEKKRTLLERLRDWVRELIALIKGDAHNRTLESDLEYLNQRLARVYDSATKITARFKSGDVKWSINAFQDGRRYVKADRQVITGDDVSKWGAQVTNYINNSIRQGRDITVYGADGDALTITRDTAGKAQFRNYVARKDGTRRLMTDDEYAVKLRAETHIDELSEVSTRGKKDIPDKKKHKFAKDGFNYRTAYFLDNDGKYYRITMSVGKNGEINTVYNVGKIKETERPLVAQRPNRIISTEDEFNSVSNNSISNSKENVKQRNAENESVTDEDVKQFSIARGTINLKNVSNYAGRLLRQNRSSHDKAQLAEQISNIISAADKAEWGKAMHIAMDAAKDIISSSSNAAELTADATEVLNEIRSTPISFNDSQKKESAFAWGSYNEYRKRNMGRINLKKDGTPLDVKWQEWAEQYPHLFDADMADVDMPGALTGIVESLKSEYETFDTDSAVSYLAEQIFTEALNTRGNKRTALDDAVSRVQEKYESELKSMTRKLSQQEKRIARQNEQLKKTRSEIQKEETARRDERRDKQKNIEYIRREVSRIDKKLRGNSEKNPVPQELQEAVKSFCNIFLQNDQTVFDRKELALVYLAYSEMEGDFRQGGETLLGTYDFDIDQQMKNLVNILEGKTLRELNVAELQIIRDIVDNFRHIIVNENKLFVQGKSLEITEFGDSILNDLRGQKAKKEFGVKNKKGQSVFESNTTPIYFFDKLGKQFRQLFDDIRDGQDKWYVNMENAKTFILQAKQKYHYSEWTDDTFKFTTVNGDNIELTREQAMLLYATAKREKLNAAQMAEHLFRGGIVLDFDGDVKSAIKKLKNSDEEGIKKVVDAFTYEVDARAHQITPIDVGRVNEWLTTEQKAYADEMVEFLSKDMAALGNETSMQLFGIRKFNEDYYIPYNSASNFLYSQPGVTASDSRLKHQSFTKQTQRKANNPLLLSDFSSVCADHINRMCMYNALTVPLENLNRVFNYNKSGSEGVAPKSVKTEIQRAYGDGAVSYLNQFINDMNGSVRTSSADSEMSKWIGRFKKGAVFLSASVVVQQPSAIARAFALIDPKYFVKTTVAVSERDYQQLIRYAPVAGIKEMGRFDTGLGVENTKWLLREDPKGVKEKVKAFTDISDSSYRDDKLSYFAAKADELTWAHIWAAVKAETADKTDLKVGSKEFLEYAGKRFRDIIDYTQVYDSTISRSQNMRDKSATAKMLTAFMAEPTVSLNLLMDATRKGLSGSKEGKRYFGRAVAAFVTSVAFNSLLKSIVTAARDDDEDKSYLEKYLGDFVGNATSDLFVPNMIPFIKDIVSIFEGYSVDRADMNLFSDLADSFNDIQSDNKTTAEKIESIAGSLAAFAGLPVKNVLRDVKSVFNVYEDLFVNENPTTLNGVRFSIEESLGINDSLSEQYEALASAAKEDNEEEYQRIYAHLIEKGKTDSQIRSGIKKSYKNSSEVKKETQEHMKQLEGNDTLNSFDSADRDKVEKNIASILATEKMVQSTERNYDVYDELYAALRKSRTLYNRKRKQLLEKGYTENQIDDGVEIARIAYMKEVGIDVHEYVLAKLAMSKKYADTDGSGGVSNAEKKKAIKNIDFDQKTKSALIKNLI